MCCFSGPVERVADTRIFARLSGRGGSQFLVYQMTYAAPHAVAMILPLPVLAATDSANPVRFIDLKGYPTFFGDLEKEFPQLRSRGSLGGGGGFGGGSEGIARTLPVFAVGDFEASFVPTLDDFRRLDARFTLPRQTWDQIPAYQNYGFAVFQLSPAAAQNEAKRVHPMAFEFETRNVVGGGTSALFFPTVHIHDGRVHAREEFDHALYFQARQVAGRGALPVRPIDSSGGFGRFVKPGRAHGIVQEGVPGYKMTLRGSLPNRDVWVPVTA